MNKSKVLKDFGTVSEGVISQFSLQNPLGFDKKLIIFKNKEGKLEGALLPFEMANKYYLIRMTNVHVKE